MTASPWTSCASARISQVVRRIPRVGIDAAPRKGQQTQPSLVGLTLAERLDQPEQILFDREPIGSRGKSGKLGQSHLDELEVLARKVEMGSRYRRLGFLEFLLADQDGNPHVQDLSFRRRRVGSRRRVELGRRLVQPAATEEQVGLEQAGESLQARFGHRFLHECQGVGFAGSADRRVHRLEAGSIRQRSSQAEADIVRQDFLEVLDGNCPQSNDRVIECGGGLPRRPAIPGVQLAGFPPALPLSPAINRGLELEFACSGMARILAVEFIEQTHGPRPAFLSLIGCHSPPGRAIESSSHFLNERLALADRERCVLDLRLERGQVLGQLIARRGLLSADDG